MYLFDQDIRLTEETSGICRVKISENWSINGNPNGGYLMAVIAHAMLRQSSMQDLIICTAT